MSDAAPKGSDVNADEHAVRRALEFFYLAIEDLVDGRGLSQMEAAWHHTSEVSSKHPMSDWAVGWEEVWATWQIAAGFGKPGRGGSKLIEARVHVCGELAYAAVIFQSSPAWGGERLMCTNVLRRLGGHWKLVHHHADTGPGMVRALEGMIASG